jgi:hypothetical protein
MAASRENAPDRILAAQCELSSCRIVIVAAHISFNQRLLYKLRAWIETKLIEFYENVLNVD